MAAISIPVVLSSSTAHNIIFYHKALFEQINVLGSCQ
jgi:hypothetical protein